LNAVNYIAKGAAERAGVNQTISVQWLKHAHAGHAIDNGVSVTQP
jgi:site-specific recombinase XerD